MLLQVGFLPFPSCRSHPISSSLTIWARGRLDRYSGGMGSKAVGTQLGRTQYWPRGWRKGGSSTTLRPADRFLPLSQRADHGIRTEARSIAARSRSGRGRRPLSSPNRESKRADHGFREKDTAPTGTGQGRSQTAFVNATTNGPTLVRPGFFVASYHTWPHVPRCHEKLRPSFCPPQMFRGYLPH